MRDARIIDALIHSHWAILPAKLDMILSVVHAHMNGKMRVTQIQATAEREAREAARQSGSPGGGGKFGIGVIPIHGTIFPRGSEMSDVSGVTTTEAIRGQLADFMDNDRVDAIILDIDSPGGVVQGVPETAEAIFEARKDKQIIAQVWDMAASAGYWIASQASEIVVTPSGEVGSVGVFAVHRDESQRLANEGIKIEILRSTKSPHKAEMNPIEPMTDEARVHEIQELDAIYDEFVDAVARGRGVTTSAVQEKFGQGRLVRAADAINSGMADRAGTFAYTVKRISKEIQQSQFQVRADESLRLIRSRYI